ncbi:hypothetical protein HDU67_004786 [Dinochytrium kinnereticum]|nr:hypothetical protein HDU67_004786 [Dinochytrium kinnereticum]
MHGSRLKGNWGQLTAVPFPTSTVSNAVRSKARSRLLERGFPLEIPGPTAWTKATLRNPIFPITKSLADDLERSLETFAKSNTPLETISPAVFPLSRWGNVLEEVKDTLFAGPGFLLLRGLDASRFSKLELATIFVGLGSHIGRPVSQNGKGDLLGHVRDLGLDVNNPNTRIYATSEAQRFHTDSCDVVGLLCLNPAQEGGESFVVSSHTIWNHIIKAGREDLADCLTSEEWYWDRKGEVPFGKLPYYKSPIYNLNADGKLMCIYDRNFFRTTARHEGVPPLTETQIEAMDALESLSYEHSFGHDLEAGDIQLCHNPHMLHARSGFMDPPEAAGRYLLRLWLSSATRGWKLPLVFQERYGPLRADGSRTGIVLPDVQKNAQHLADFLHDVKPIPKELEETDVDEDDEVDNVKAAGSRRSKKGAADSDGDAEVEKVKAKVIRRPKRGAADSDDDKPSTPSKKKKKTAITIPNVLLAKKWDEDIDPKGWWMSEKLDGVRAYWHPEAEAFVSRNGNQFFAPDWFTKDLPRDMSLDGELFAGRGKFSSTVSVVKSMDSPNWSKIVYHIFDAPSIASIPFERRMDKIKEFIKKSKIPHIRLVDNEECKGKSHLFLKLDEVEKKGGEGLMLRKPKSQYEFSRSNTLLKVKTFYDAEAEVIGHEKGTGKNSQVMGAIRCKMASGQTFKIGSGFTDKERAKPPKIGSIVTYKFQELSGSGVPRFPTFVGVRIDADKASDAQIRTIVRTKSDINRDKAWGDEDEEDK